MTQILFDSICLIIGIFMLVISSMFILHIIRILLNKN